jgi:pimeloyl-ACP methyl ester carboxylesterase
MKTPIESFSHQNITVNGVRLHYVTAGSGSPLLLWHGFCETWYCWREVMSILSEKYMVIAPDMRGYGDSEKPAEGYDGLNLAEDFRAIVQHHTHDRLMIAAHDMGAPAALLYAATYPEEVSALAYIEEPLITRDALLQNHAFNPETASTGRLWWWKMALAPEVADRFIVGREREFLTWFYKFNTFQQKGIPESAVTEYLRTFSGTEGVNGALGVYRAIFTTMEQTDPFLFPSRHLKVPILGVGGFSSRGNSVMEQFAPIALNVSGTVMLDCGHFPSEEKPEELAAILDNYFIKFKA